MLGTIDHLAQRNPHTPRTGSPLAADGSAGPTTVVVVPAAAAAGDSEWGASVVSTGFAVDLDAGILVDAMSRALLAHTRTAILEGQRPDGGGPQAELSQRALAAEGRQSEHRGYKSGELADGLRRTAIESNGREASCKIYPPTSRTAYVAKERKRGIVLLTGAGAAGAAAAEAARAAVGAMMSGASVEHDRSETVAKDAT